MATVIAADHPTPIDPTAGLSSTAFGWTMVVILWLSAALIGAASAYALSVSLWSVARVLELLLAAGLMVGGFALVWWLGTVELPISFATLSMVAAAAYVAPAAIIGGRVLGSGAAHKEQR